MNNGVMSVAMRSDSDASQLANVLRREVHRLDPALAVYDVRLLDQITDANLASARFAFFLVGLFAALAVGLAAVGTYGVIAYSVGRRSHEFGLRMALGASRWDVVRLVFGRGVTLAAIGVALGLLAGLGLARVLRSLIYEVSPADPLTFGAVAVLVFSVAALACYLPARRATQADPDECPASGVKAELARRLPVSGLAALLVDAGRTPGLKCGMPTDREMRRQVKAPPATAESAWTLRLAPLAIERREQSADWHERSHR